MRRNSQHRDPATSHRQRPSQDMLSMDGPDPPPTIKAPFEETEEFSRAPKRCVELEVGHETGATRALT